MSDMGCYTFVAFAVTVIWSTDCARWDSPSKRSSAHSRTLGYRWYANYYACQSAWFSGRVTCRTKPFVYIRLSSIFTFTGNFILLHETMKCDAIGVAVVSLVVVCTSRWLSAGGTVASGKVALSFSLLLRKNKLYDKTDNIYGIIIMLGSVSRKSTDVSRSPNVDNFFINNMSDMS